MSFLGLQDGPVSQKETHWNVNKIGGIPVGITLSLLDLFHEQKQLISLYLNLDRIIQSSLLITRYFGTKNE